MSTTLALHDVVAVRRIEARAIAGLGDAHVLMRRAGQSAWRYLLQHWPQAHRIVVVCGPGNNGGDGYVLARHALESGRYVRVLRLRAHTPRSDECRRACQEYLSAGGPIEEFERAFPDADMVVDALFGIGLSRAPDDATSALIDAMNHCGVPILALDVPSGIDADRGQSPGVAVRATRTLQFIAARTGLYTGAALDHVGATDIAGLDIDAKMFAGCDPSAILYSPDALSTWLSPRPRDSHKGSNGHVLCIGGDGGMGGAIALCAEAALRCGAGLTSVATRQSNVVALLARRPECMARAVTTKEQLRPLLDRANAIAVGPGLGKTAWSKALFDAAVNCEKPVVVDADALNLLAMSPRALPRAVLTPHPGEAARLLQITTEQVQKNRFVAARTLAKKYACTIVLKGAGTLVAAPEQMPRVIAAGNPGMATGGMGDVLTGVIAALIAQGLPAFEAATCGALLHATAGDEAARAGERGLLASDLFPCLRRLLNP